MFATIGLGFVILIGPLARYVDDRMRSQFGECWLSTHAPLTPDHPDVNDPAIALRTIKERGATFLELPAEARAAAARLVDVRNALAHFRQLSTVSIEQALVDMETLASSISPSAAADVAALRTGEPTERVSELVYTLTAGLKQHSPRVSMAVDDLDLWSDHGFAPAETPLNVPRVPPIACPIDEESVSHGEWLDEAPWSVGDEQGLPGPWAPHRESPLQLLETASSSLSSHRGWPVTPSGGHLGADGDWVREVELRELAQLVAEAERQGLLSTY